MITFWSDLNKYGPNICIFVDELKIVKNEVETDTDMFFLTQILGQNSKMGLQIVKYFQNCLSVL